MTLQMFGIYSPAEVARYACLPQATVKTWFWPRSDGAGRGAVFRPDYEDVVRSDVPALSFLNLIEAKVARFFREEGVKAAVIRKARECLQRDLQTEHPFAHEDLRTDGRSIFRAISDEVDAESFADAITHQHWFREFKAGLAGIRYSEENKLADQLDLGDGIVLDPQRRYGKPIVSDCSMPTAILANAYYANGEDAEAVADWYSVTPGDVLAAVGFESRSGAAA